MINTSRSVLNLLNKFLPVMKRVLKRINKTAIGKKGLRLFVVILP